MRKLLTVLLLAMSLPLVAIPAFVATHRSDLERIDDADLEIPWLDLAPEENGFWHLDRAAEALHWPEGTDDWVKEVLDGGPGDDARITELLARNVEARAHVRRALAARAFQAQSGIVSLDFNYGDLAPSNWYRLLHLLCLEAVVAARQDRTEAWLGALSESMRLARQVETAIGGDLVYAVVGSNMKGRGLRTLQTTVGLVQVDAALALDLDNKISTLAAHGWPHAWPAEYQRVKRMLLDLADAPVWRTDDPPDDLFETTFRMLPPDYLLHPRRSVRRFGDEISAYLAKADRPCKETPRPKATTLESLRRSFGPNAVGEISVAWVAPAGRLVAWRHRCDDTTVIEATRAAVALRRYQQDHGELPERLDVLVPGYLVELPRDGFDGRPLRWSREARLLWSVGADFSDPEPIDVEGSPGEPRFPIRF